MDNYYPWWKSAYVYSMGKRTTEELEHYRKCLGGDKMYEPKTKREILTKLIDWRKERGIE